MPYFVFSDGRDTFAVQILDPAKVAHARGLIDGSITDGAHIGGIVTVAPTDYNIGWSYHIAPEDVSFYDFSAEIGDAPIRDVEEFVNSGRPLDEFLPHNFWGSWVTFVVRELREIAGTAQADALFGTRAAEIIFGHDGQDSLRGGAGHDFLVGGLGGDRLYGGLGADKLGGGEGIDELHGGAGNDVLDGGRGADRMYGGLGNDIFIVQSLGDITSEHADGGTDLVKSSISHALQANLEQLKLLGAQNINGRGNDENNVLIGNSGNNRLWGLGGDDKLYGDGGDSRIASGNDRLYGGAGDDRLYGGEGKDRLDGGAGVDRIYGGLGNDTYYVTDATDYVYEHALEGTDSVYASVSHTLAQDVERLYLTGTAATTATGNVLANLLTGNDAANLLRGLGGNDLLRGAGGDDVIDGGAGRDCAYGGSGADEFVFRTGEFGGATSATADIVRDFSQRDGDLLNLDLVDANSTLTGRQNFTFIGTAAFSGTAGELRYQQGTSDTFVIGDTNGDGIADFMIRLDGLHALTSGDFVL